ncbi:MAG: hypothetical protein M1421_06100 [Candidatus Eremiobacteraeota bacterium]|jgi:hypothetical protein|nr:hypothetical protein [Candidatus Eremiobacteraeota bacterium]MCL5055119.1 hypothetical protein [Bacillota bacterium]
MIKKVLSFISGFFFLCLSVHAEAVNKLAEENPGPGQFYYQAYWHQPWRLPDTPIRILEQSGYLLLACCIVWFYNWKRKNQS